jgi:hypothetical protein
MDYLLRLGIFRQRKKMKLKPHRISKEEKELRRILSEEILKEVTEFVIRDIKQIAQKGNKMTTVFKDKMKR